MIFRDEDEDEVEDEDENEDYVFPRLDSKSLIKF